MRARLGARLVKLKGELPRFRTPEAFRKSHARGSNPAHSGHEIESGRPRLFRLRITAGLICVCVPWSRAWSQNDSLINEI